MDDNADWLEVRALSSLVFGTAIGLVENADLSEMGKRGIQELMVRGYHVFTSAMDDCRNLPVGTEKLAPVDKAVTLCAAVVSDFEQLGERVEQLGQTVYDGRVVQAWLWPVSFEPHWTQDVIRLQGFEATFSCCARVLAGSSKTNLA